MKFTYIISFILLNSVAFATFTGSDNFNDNTLNTGIWGHAPATDLVETNTHLEYIATASSNEQWDNISWKHGEGGSYTSDWSVSVDLHLSGFNNSTWTNKLISLKLLTFNSADRGDEFSIGFEIYAEDDSGTLERGQSIAGMIATDGNFENAAEIWTNYTGTDVTVKLDYTASNTLLQAYYDTGSGFNVLTNFDASAWGMINSNKFNVELSISNWDLDITSGQVYFDNFSALGTNSSPLIQVGIQKAVEIGWNSISGRSYQVEYSTALKPKNWIKLGDLVIGNGTTNYIFDSIRTDSKRFYRVLLTD